MNLRQLLIGTFSRLRYVMRWSTFRNVHPESVAEHSFYVALYSLFICEWLRTKDSLLYLTTYDALAKALVHDLEEARSGDMPRDFKISDTRLEDILKLTSRIAMKQALDELAPVSAVHSRVTAWWENAKSSDLTGSIVAFADFLSVLSYLLQERQDQNYSVATHVQGMRKYYTHFLDTRYDFIRELVQETEPFLKELEHEQPE